MADRRRDRPRLVAAWAWLAVAAATATGCAFLPATASPEVKAAAKPMPRTVAIEAVFVRLAADETTTEEAIWQAADEQAIDAELRRRLVAHGLRAGIVSAPLPMELRTTLDRAAIVPSQEGPQPTEDRIVTRRVLRLLPGKEGRLVARGSLTELVVFESPATGSELLGRTFRDATSELVLTAWHAADGRSRIAIVPAIEHGPHRRTWTGEDGVFRLEAGQSRHSFEPLRIDVEIPPDRMVVVGGHGTGGSSVASALFHEPGGDRRIVILRPIGRTQDPMFEDRFGDEPHDTVPEPPSNGTSLPDGVTARPQVSGTSFATPGRR